MAAMGIVSAWWVRRVRVARMARSYTNPMNPRRNILYGSSAMPREI